MKKVKLGPGETHCEDCGGTGFTWDGMCWKCQGNGKFDWIEKIIKKKKLYAEENS